MVLEGKADLQLPPVLAFVVPPVQPPGTASESRPPAVSAAWPPAGPPPETLGGAESGAAHPAEGSLQVAS